MLSAGHIGLIEIFPGAPKTGLGRNVKNDVYPGTSRSDRFRVGQISLNKCCPSLNHLRIIASGKDDNLIPLSQQLLHNVAP